MHNTIKITGHLSLYIDGQLVADHPNQVTNLGCEAIWGSVFGAAGYNIATMEGGTGTASPLATDTALGTSVFTKAVTSVALATSKILEVTFDIIAGEATGVGFKEFGLFVANGDMFARWCDGNTYTKTASPTNTIQGVWRFTLSN